MHHCAIISLQHSALSVFRSVGQVLHLLARLCCHLSSVVTLVSVHPQEHHSNVIVWKLIGWDMQKKDKKDKLHRPDRHENAFVHFASSYFCLLLVFW